MNDNRPEFSELIQQFARGSEEAAQQIVEQYSGNILRAIRKRLPEAIRSKLDSVDIFQSVWLSVLDDPAKLADFENPSRLIAYLVGTSRLKVLEKYRHFTRKQAYDIRREARISDHVELGRAGAGMVPAKDLVVDKHQSSASTAMEAREAWENLLSHCDERDHQVLELRISGMTYEEIAERMNISTRTVCRSLEKMKTAISQ